MATITMNDGKANALGFVMFAALNEALDQAEADAAAVVLAGRPGLFSAGFDLSVVSGRGPETARLMGQGFELSYRMLSYSRPVVIACTGHAFAMASFVLLSGDYRVGPADDRFKITANEVSIGLTMPRSAIEICRQRLTPNHFDRVVMLAEIFKPVLAVEAGFLDEVVAEADVVSTAQTKAADLMKLDPGAHAATKARVRASALAALRTAIIDDDNEMQSWL